jgi:hypothetical protein
VWSGGTAGDGVAMGDRMGLGLKLRYVWRVEMHMADAHGLVDGGYW